MTGWLLDTNVVSELARSEPSKKVQSFAQSLTGASYLSVITLHELDYGVAGLRDGKRKRDFVEWLDALEQQFAECVLPVSRQVARHAALLRRKAQAQGCVLHLADALIAGTVIDSDLRLVTRNVADFRPTGIVVSNPWAAG